MLRRRRECGSSIGRARVCRRADAALPFSAALLDRHRLGEVARLVHISSLHQRGVS